MCDSLHPLNPAIGCWEAKDVLKSDLKTIVTEQVGDSSYNAKAGVTGEKPSPLEIIRKY